MCNTDKQNEHFTTQSTTYPLYPTSPPPPTSPSISQIRKEAMIQNFGQTLGTDPKTIPSWGILTNLASHSISMMRELIGSPIGVGYASRSGGVGSRSDINGKQGEGVGWWNVIFDYEGFKAHYEVCPFFLLCYSLLLPLRLRLPLFPPSPHPSSSRGIEPSIFYPHLSC
jgi:hypothetical protein